MTGGNGTCHCVHVAELLIRVDTIERRTPDPYSRTTVAERGGDPWQPGYEPGRAHRDDAGAPGGRTTLPLRLEEPLGSALQHGNSLFDGKLTTSEEYRVNGVKGGFAWKGKTERHFVSRCLFSGASSNGLNKRSSKPSLLKGSWRLSARP